MNTLKNTKKKKNRTAGPKQLRARKIKKTGKKEITLEETEEKYSNLFHNSNDGIFMHDLDGNIIDVNQKALDMFGYSRAEIMQCTIAELHPPEALAISKYAFDRISRDGFVSFEIDFKKENGDIFPAEVSSSLFEIRGQKVIQGIVRDISERKRAEKALAQEKEQLAVTLRSIGDGVITTDVEGRIILVNYVAEALTGWNHEEASGRALGEIFNIISEGTREPCENPVEKVLREGTVVGFANDTILVSKDGTERIISDSGAPIRDLEGNIIGVVLVFRDVTERRMLERELQKASKLESVGILAGGIAHDFNNFLTGVLANIHLAQMAADSKEEVFTRLTEAEKAALMAKDLTQQLLTFSEGGVPVMRATSVGELIKETTVFALRGSSIQPEFHIADDLWNVEVDVGQIGQVINNLVINAVQAMPDGGVVKVEAENVVLAGEELLPLFPGRYVKVSVTDTGVGIHPDYVSRIFDPYFTTKQKGSGLGLAICYSIISKHSGHISVDSSLGEGTTFHIYLLAVKEDAAPGSHEQIDTSRGSGRILFMDDEELIRRAVPRMLSASGYEVECAVDGSEAIEKYKSAIAAGSPYDIVIMDLTVSGGMGGKEAIQELLDIDPDVKVIVSSGYSNDPIMANFKDYGFTGIIAKPYTASELRRVIIDLLGD